MKILVIGDYISDVYTFGKATRLCPEAPVPVIVPKSDKRTAGGVGLVYEQLLTLGAKVNSLFLSYSEKHRYFADNHLICRIDNDPIDKDVPTVYELKQEHLDHDAFVISDYGKGAMTRELARQIVDTGKPCFVDAKHHWDWYWFKDTYFFPNEHELLDVEPSGRIIRKLGAKGCEREDLRIPATVSEVVDVTGAGDIFMASFVYAWSLQLLAEDCLRFANEMAGESCRHLGTYVVPLEFAQGVVDRLLVSKQPDGQALSNSGYSSAQAYPEDAAKLRECGIQKSDSSLDKAYPLADFYNHFVEQNLLQSPSDPKSESDAQLLQASGESADNLRKMGYTIQSSTENSNQCEHKPARDRVPHPAKS